MVGSLDRPPVCCNRRAAVWGGAFGGNRGGGRFFNPCNPLRGGMCLGPRFHPDAPGSCSSSGGVLFKGGVFMGFREGRWPGLRTGFEIFL